VDALAVPYWLAGHSIDLNPKQVGELDLVRQEFLRVLEEEERKENLPHSISLARAMQQSWESGAMWFWYCLDSVNAMLFLVKDHISPRFSSLSFEAEKILCRYWSEDSSEFIKRKLAEHEAYLVQLKAQFDSRSTVSDDGL
jgi:hypothetical protein